MTDLENVPNIDSRSAFEIKTDTPEVLFSKKQPITPESLKNSRRNSLLPCSDSSSRLGSKNTQRPELPSSTRTVGSVVDELSMTAALKNEVP